MSGHCESCGTTIEDVQSKRRQYCKCGKISAVDGVVYRGLWTVKESEQSDMFPEENRFQKYPD